MCEIDSLASTFVPNLCDGPKGFPFSLKNFFFRLYEFLVIFNCLFLKKIRITSKCFICFFSICCLASIVYVYQFLFCFKNPLSHTSRHTYFL
uniref:Uncharacterized protein n=1 Tax=Balaenoptera musculus TaxID=9771 RepID=A0A8C0DJN6_BALMU